MGTGGALIAGSELNMFGTFVVPSTGHSKTSLWLMDYRDRKKCYGSGLRARCSRCAAARGVISRTRQTVGSQPRMWSVRPSLQTRDDFGKYPTRLKNNRTLDCTV